MKWPIRELTLREIERGWLIPDSNVAVLTGQRETVEHDDQPERVEMVILGAVHRVGENEFNAFVHDPPSSKDGFTSLENAMGFVERETTAWIEIYHYHLHCTCGHVTESKEWHHADGGTAVCENCGKTWWAPVAADCERMGK